jgi:hypothetical protein
MTPNPWSLIAAGLLLLSARQRHLIVTSAFGFAIGQWLSDVYKKEAEKIVQVGMEAIGAFSRHMVDEHLTNDDLPVH